MNKLIIWIVGGAIVIGGIGVIIYFTNNGANVKNTADKSTTEVKTGDKALASVNACDILTEEIAKNIIGDTAERGNIETTQAATKDVTVSDCVYTAKIDPNGKIGISNKNGVNVLVRAAISSDGAKTNKDQFGDMRPTGVQNVSGLGDSAYYAPEYGQLNVLKGNNWYIVTSYSGAIKGTLETDKQLAAVLNFK